MDERVPGSNRSDDKPTRYCRITGLTKDAGKSMNGSAAIVQTADAEGDPDQRLMIGAVDGRPGGPAKVKRSNIIIFPERYEVIGTGVGRGTLRDKEFNAVISSNQHSTILSSVPVSGGCARSRGILKALERFLQSDIMPPHLNLQQNPQMHWLVLPTDLNVARALNKLVLNEPAHLAPALDGTLQSIRQLLIQKNMVDDAISRRILVKFEPHRCLPTIFDQPVKAKCRVAAVTSGTYHIYPCPYEEYMDAVEVRYVDTSTTQTSSTSKPQCTIYQDIYIDYGTEEALMYPRNAAALHELDRLTPLALADVDPQMFWALVLRLDQLLPLLKELGRADLVAQWAVLANGVKRQTTRLTQFLQNHKGFLGTLTLTDDEHVFLLEQQDNTKAAKKQHADLALDHAVLALTMLEDVVSPGETRTLPRVDFFDIYKTAPMGKIMLPYAMAGKMEQRVPQSLKGRRAAIYNFFVSYFPEETCGPDPAESCEHCGAIDHSPYHSNATSLQLLQDCGGCGGVAYCSRDCQKRAWKTHKPNCSRLDAHAGRIMRRLKPPEGEHALPGSHFGF